MCFLYFSSQMADEQLTLTIEQLAESVRTAMTREDAEEPLSQLTDLMERECTNGRLAPELTGQIFRSLLPAFVMTDADFKTPASMSAPTKAMYLVKDECVGWLLELSKKFPEISTPVPVDRAGYRRRMRMCEPEEEGENRVPSNNGLLPEDEEEEEGEERGEKTTRSNSQVVLDPIVGLLQRLAVRCPDKAEWRRSACDCIVKICDRIEKTGDRFVENFLIYLMVSEKSAWRGFACEACAGLAGLGSLDTATRDRMHRALISRCRDNVSSVRAKALTSIFNEKNSETLNVFRERAMDEKPSVRRAAVSLFDPQQIGSLDVIAMLAKDESLMVRKGAISSILSLLDSASASLQVCELYVNTVLPMVTDVETSVVEKVVESFQQSFLHDLSPSMLRAVGASRDSIEFARRCLKLTLRSTNMINKSFMKRLETLVSENLTRNNSESSSKKMEIHVALSLMEEIAQVSPSLVPANTVAENFLPILISLSHGEDALIECLKIMTILKNLDPHSSSLLQAFLSDPHPTTFRMDVIHFVVRCLSNSQEDTCKNFFEKISEKSISAMDSVIFSAACPPSIVWHVVLLGELAGLGILPSVKGLTSIEAIATNRVYLNGTEHFSLPAPLRAAAMVAFGQICLQKESIAKRAVSKFAAHLSKEEHPVVRNNVLIVLGDLCVVYTGLVDQYLPWLTTCLSDPNDLIRLQAAVVVSSLLAEDYIKFKGQIVFRLLYLLSDPNEKIKFFTESVFSRILFLRHSGSLKTLFSETVCALNGFLRHPAYQGAVGNKDFLLTLNSKRRREIYAFMLTNIVTTEQKFNATAQLANALLSAFVDSEDDKGSSVSIPDTDEGPAGQVLIDTLYLLSHPGLKLSTSSSSSVEETSEDKETREKRLFDSALQKKTVVENLVPLLIQLNSLCEQKRSPISKYVRECLKELVKDYKDEVTSILHSDSQLAQELLYDLGVQQSGAEPVVEPPELPPPEKVEQTEDLDVEPPEIDSSRAKKSKKNDKKKKDDPEDESFVVKHEEDDEQPKKSTTTRATRKRRNE